MREEGERERVRPGEYEGYRHNWDPFLLGSAEGFTLAEKAISSASKTGRWVLLKNVHLAPQWLVQLEKKLHSITPHANFRLFLTMEINPR